MAPSSAAATLPVKWSTGRPSAVANKDFSAIPRMTRLAVSRLNAPKTKNVRPINDVTITVARSPAWWTICAVRTRSVSQRNTNPSANANQDTRATFKAVAPPSTTARRHRALPVPDAKTPVAPTNVFALLEQWANHTAKDASSPLNAARTQIVQRLLFAVEKKASPSVKMSVPDILAVLTPTAFHPITKPAAFAVKDSKETLPTGMSGAFVDLSAAKFNRTAQSTRSVTPEFANQPVNPTQNAKMVSLAFAANVSILAPWMALAV